MFFLVCDFFFICCQSPSNKIYKLEVYFTTCIKLIYTAHIIFFNAIILPAQKNKFEFGDEVKFDSSKKFN